MATRLIEFVRSPFGFRLIVLTSGSALVAASVLEANWTLALATAAVFGSLLLMKR